MSFHVDYKVWKIQTFVILFCDTSDTFYLSNPFSSADMFTVKD